MSTKRSDPREYDREMMQACHQEHTGREREASKKWRGFPIGASAQQMASNERSFAMMRKAQAHARSNSIECYYTEHLPYTAWEDDEETGEAVEVQKIKSTLRYLDMQQHIFILARESGSIARRAKIFLEARYRTDWGGLHSKYLKETEAERDRRIEAAGGGSSVVLWNTELKVYKDIAERGTQLKLLDPEYRDYQSRYDQREEVLGFIRSTIRKLAKCAVETRTANPGTQWCDDEGGATMSPFRVPLDAEQLWDEAIALFYMIQKVLTRHTDANEKALMMKAVVYELYHNEHQLSVHDVLEFLNKHSEETPQLYDFVREFNRREWLHIRDKTACSWARARQFVFMHHAVSSRAAATNLCKWWLEMSTESAMAAPHGWRFQDEMDVITAEDNPASIPDGIELDDWLEMAAEARWKARTPEQRMRLKAMGNASAGAQDALLETQERKRLCAEAAEARLKRMLELQKMADTTAGENSMLAFPKPDTIEGGAAEQFRLYNPDHLKEQELKKKRKQEREDKRKAAEAAGTIVPRKAPAAKRRRIAPKPQSAGASPAGPSSAQASDDESSDDDVPQARMVQARRTAKVAAFGSDSSDNSDDE